MASTSLLETSIHLSTCNSDISKMRWPDPRSPSATSAAPHRLSFQHLILKRYTDLRESNPDLEELYFQYGRYLLISSSRTPGVPANLQGLWNDYVKPPWACDYHNNINVQMA